MFKIFNVLLAATFLFSTACHAEEKAEWSQCHVDSDCVLIGEGCTIRAVNRPFVDEATQYAKEQQGKVNCLIAMDKSKLHPVCKDVGIVGAAEKNCAFISTLSPQPQQR
jgi:hypothetical protein